MEATHSEIYKMWFNHVKFNGWEVSDKENDNKDNGEQKIYIDQVPFL